MFNFFNLFNRKKKEEERERLRVYTRHLMDTEGLDVDNYSVKVRNDREYMAKKLPLEVWDTLVELTIEDDRRKILAYYNGEIDTLRIKGVSGENNKLIEQLEKNKVRNLHRNKMNTFFKVGEKV